MTLSYHVVPRRTAHRQAQKLLMKQSRAKFALRLFAVALFLCLYSDKARAEYRRVQAMKASVHIHFQNLPARRASSAGMKSRSVT
jgi:hypothetical protein